MKSKALRGRGLTRGAPVSASICNEVIAVREDSSPAVPTVTAQTAIVKSLLSFGARVGYLRANLGELFKLKTTTRTKSPARSSPAG